MIHYQSDNSVGNYSYNIYIYKNGNWAQHFHKNYELIYVLSGELNLTVDNLTEVITENSFALIHPNQVHTFSTEKSSVIWVAVFSADFIKEFARLTKGKQGERLKFYCNDNEISYLKAVLLRDGKQDILSLKSSLYIVCNRYLKEISLSERYRISSDLAHIIIDYTEKNFRDDISLADIAKELGYEYHYFSRCFKRLFNMNFKAFLNQYRFNYAQNLMLSTDKSLSQIAMESGFGSLRNFNRIYRRFANEAPTAHAKNNPD